MLEILQQSKNWKILFYLDLTVFYYRKLEDFTEGGKIDQDKAKVRFDHYNSKRKAKLIAINQQLPGFDPNGKQHLI